MFLFSNRYVEFTVPLRGTQRNTTLQLHLFNGLFCRTTWVSWYQKGRTSLDLNEARDDGVLGCSGISWTICKQSAPRSRQITTPTPHHSFFTGRMPFLTPNQQCQSTDGKHTTEYTKLKELRQADKFSCTAPSEK